MATCGRCGEGNPERARFCLACGSPLPGRSLGESRKTITVLFADLVESAALGEGIDPESLRSVMSRYYLEMRSTVERHGGVVEKFIGDAVVGVFGVPVAHEDDALRAVRAGLEMQRRMATLGEELEPALGRRLAIRVAINTGEVVAGAGVDGATGLVGDPINTAARLEKAAPPGGVVVGAPTRRLVARSATTRSLGPLDIPGRTAPVEVFVVEDVAEASSEPGFETPMVGRARELAALSQAFDRVVEERTCVMFTLLGAAGVGKSRVVREFVDSVGDRGRVVRGRCLPYGEGITFWPVMEVVLDAAGITERDSQAEAREKIAGLLDRDEDAESVTNLVAHAVGLGHTNAGQEEIFWAVRRLVDSVARRGPLVVVFDDVHWGEEVFLDLVDYLAEWARDVPLLIVCLARPELLEARPAWGGGKLNSVTMLLEALRGPESRRLLESLLGGDPSIVAGALDPVLEVAGGNPLFLEETIAMLVEDGALRSDDGRWTATKHLGQVDIPPTIHALLTARLDQLPHDERAALEVASVAGKVFSVGDVSHLLQDPPGIRESFDALARKGLVRRDPPQVGGDDWFRFRHILIRDAAYQRLPKGRRAELHEKYAGWLEEALGPRFVEYEEVIGYHLEQAARSLEDLGQSAPVAQRAAETLVSAARRASDRGDVRAAESLLHRASSLTDEGPLWAQIRLELGDVLREAGSFTEAVRAFEEVESTPAAVDADVRALARLRRDESTIHVSPHVTAEDTQRAAERAFETFDASGNLVGMAESMRLLAFAFDTMGRSQDSQACIRRAISYAEQAGDRRRANSYRRTLMGSISWGPIPIPDLIEEAQRFVAWAREHSDKRAEARGHAVLGGAYASCGRLDEARLAIGFQKKLHDDLGLEMARAWSAFESAWVEVLGGDLAAAEEELRWACAVCERCNEQAVLPTLRGVLADVVYASGDVDEADRLARQVEAMSADDDVLSQVKWRTVRAKIVARDGDEAAKVLVDEAVELVGTTEYLDWRALAHLDRARVLVALGLPGAEHDLAAAEDLFARKGITTAVDYVRNGGATELSGIVTSRTEAAAGPPPRGR
ncbi:MAG TPA: AAA family ATPase [Actinomycetota bacterium]|nr:AAA family ATPase [Actinomycetota bacterium]